MRRARFVSAFVQVFAVLAAPTTAAALELSLTSTTVKVHGLPPGGRVALFSVARVSGPFIGTIVPRHELVEDTDRDGIATLEVEGGVPWRSIWVAADPDGTIAMVTPEGFPLRRLPDSHPGFGAILGSAGRPDAVVAPGDYYEFLLVRKGSDGGFWAGTVYDGNPDDDDGPANGRVAALLSALEGIGTVSPPPDRLRPGDRVVGIDANDMTVFLFTFPPGGRP